MTHKPLKRALLNKNSVIGLAAAMISLPALADPFIITPLATYKHSANFDVSAAEIVSYDPHSKHFFVVNADAATIDVLALQEDSLTLEPAQACQQLPLSLVNGEDGFVLGGPNSVDSYNGLVAVALEHDDKQSAGRVAVFNTDDCSLWDSYPAGALPDMVAFSPDGNLLVVANEGEPSDDYTVDPEGSITIVNLQRNSVEQAGFDAFNAEEHELRAAGVRVFGPGASVAQDLEPEYVAITPDSATAYVTLQENNAVATVDLATATITAVNALGTKDHSRRKNALDYTNKDDRAHIVKAPFVGMYQPDAIGTFQRGRHTFLVTANEGDARDYEGFSEEVRVEDLNLDSDLVARYPGFLDGDDLGRPKTSTVDGDIDNDGDVDTVHLFGARSISVWRVKNDGSLKLVGDSGSDLEQAIAQQHPALFNATNDEDGLDNRSDDKGPEPEALSLVEIDHVPYAFVSLERSSQIAIFDLSQIRRPELVQVVSNRVNGALGADLGPESVIYVSAADSPIGRALMVVANEVSGTTTIYTIESRHPSHGGY
tara:strand:+ start:140592 stop:142217 length:1626 start_codon:yes stop_codon:yes gene_type:complete